MNPWKTHDGREIPIEELGDKHLVNILNKIESNRKGLQPFDATTPMLSLKSMSRYDELVIEAVRRGLFEWSADRKHLSSIMNDIAYRADAVGAK